tara:strand:- start:844 stop:1587 length:744 start_codon:yes stop_codon:yes gene_type:complete
MENIDKNSVFWNHMSDEEKNLLLQSANDVRNIEENEKLKIDTDSEQELSSVKIETPDIKANNEILEEDIIDENFHYNWEDEFFKKFDWLDESTVYKNNSLIENAKYHLFLDCCKILEEKFSINQEPDLVEDYHFNKLYMYFVSLEDNHLFLYTDFKKSYENVIKVCLDKYDYVKLHKPQQVIFVLEIHDFYDVDKYVKMFMHMFGVNNTRGGSYTDIVLPDYFIETINHEKEITSIDYYLRNKNNKA